MFIPHRPGSQAATAQDLREGNGIGRYVWRKNMKFNLWQNLIVNLLVIMTFGAIPLPSKSENK